MEYESRLSSSEMLLHVRKRMRLLLGNTKGYTIDRARSLVIQEKNLFPCTSSMRGKVHKVGLMGASQIFVPTRLICIAIVQNVCLSIR